MGLHSWTWTIYVLVCLCKTVFIVCEAALEPSEHFLRSVVLEKDDVYNLFWNYDEYSITFEVHVKTTGWVMFGLSPDGGLLNSDIVIGWVKNGIPYFTDQYITNKSLPTIDPVQDWELLDGQETETHTVLKFKRPLLSCDPQDHNITTGKTWVIFSYSGADPDSETSIANHGIQSAGSKRVPLLGSYIPPSHMSSDVFHIDFVNNNVDLYPDKDTTYWCKGFKAPDFSEKHHLIKFTPIIDKRTKGLVRHIVLFACYPPLSHPELIDKVDKPCGADNIAWRQCTTLLANSDGSEKDTNFPEQAGLPFGKTSRLQYLLLELHYDNPTLRKGLQDSSGMRLWFTKSLRQYDAGILIMGMDVSPLGQILPGGYSNLTMHGHCSKECLSQGMGDTSEIHVYGVAVHTHLLGTGVRLHHYRDGVELPLAASKIKSDGFVPPPEVIIRKGDNLVTECIYNTMDKNYTSFGGERTGDEMCLSILMYYPEFELAACMSSPSQAQMASSLGFKHREIENGRVSVITDGQYAEKTLNEYMNETGVFTDLETKNKYQKAIITGEIVQNCGVGTMSYPAGGTFTQVSVVTQPYVPRKLHCWYGNG